VAGARRNRPIGYVHNRSRASADAAHGDSVVPGGLEFSESDLTITIGRSADYVAFDRPASAIVELDAALRADPDSGGSSLRDAGVGRSSVVITEIASRERYVDGIGRELNT
jgi:hypothetical protein